MEVHTLEGSNVRRHRVVKTMMDYRRGAGISFSGVPTENNLRMEGFCLACSLRVQSVKVEKAWW